MSKLCCISLFPLFCLFSLDLFVTRYNRYQMSNAHSHGHFNDITLEIENRSLWEILKKKKIVFVSKLDKITI